MIGLGGCHALAHPPEGGSQRGGGPCQPSAGGGILGSEERLEGCGTARLPVHLLPGGRDAQERPRPVNPSSHPSSCPSVRMLPPRPRASRTLAAGGDGCSRTGRRARVEGSSRFLWASHRACGPAVPLLPLLPPETGGLCKRAQEERATLRPDSGPNQAPLRPPCSAGRLQPAMYPVQQTDLPRPAGGPHTAQAPPSACRAHQDPTSTFTKIYKRSFCLLQAWLEDCYAVDFTRNSGLLGRLEDFISSKVTRGRAPEQPLHRHGPHSGPESRHPCLGGK